MFQLKKSTILCSLVLKSLLILIIGPSFTTQQPFNCYQCASNSISACADPANVDLIKTNVMSGCAGACIVYNLAGTTYRGCTTNTTLSGLVGTATTGLVTFTYCKINLCNYISASKTTATTTTAAPTTTTTTAALATTTKATLNCYNCNSGSYGCDNPFNPAYLSSVSCSGACVVFATDKVYRACTNVIKSGGSGTYMVNSVQMNYCSSNLCNTGSAPNPTTVATTTAVPSGISCYSCNSLTAGCDTPFIASNLQKISCSGACIVWINPYDYKLYRGCTNKIPAGTSPSSGITYSNGVQISYCQANLCNTGTAPPPPATTPTTTTVASGTTTTTTTSAGPTTPTTTTSSTNCLNNPSNLVSWTEFTNAVIQNGYPQPTQVQYCNYVTQLTSRGGITTKTEAAMFLAQILWESAGLTAMRELACLSTNCPNDYNSNPSAGLYYYGRGYIQLSWDYNYRAASQALYGDDRLVTNPDLVASDDSVAWATAFWYWKANVGILPNVKAGYFGTSTNAINGALECAGAYQSKAKARYDVYKVVFAAYNLPGTPIENGCYN